jgi:hypothetical protein
VSREPNTAANNDIYIVNYDSCECPQFRCDQVVCDILNRLVASNQDLVHTAFIGASSWVQQYIAGEIAWHDLQLLIDNYNRAIKMLLLPEPQETPAIRTNRNELRREYRRAMCVTIQHIIDQVTLRIADMEEELEKLAKKKGTASKQQMLGAEIEAMQPYTVGIAASNNNTLARIADAKPEGLFYAQMDVRSRVAFWQQRWSLDVFMSWNWTFNTVLHYE